MINKVSLINEIETLFPLFNNIRSETQQQVHSDKKETKKSVVKMKKAVSIFKQAQTNFALAAFHTACQMAYTATIFTLTRHWPMSNIIVPDVINWDRITGFSAFCYHWHQT